tara:strand:+ start:740 stop:1009 length:270 start_codon:yes stop_codon:yes gene_type:complete
MSSFKNPTDFVPSIGTMPIPQQQRVSQFIADLTPEQIPNFKFDKKLLPYNIVHKQVGMVNVTFRMPKKIYGNSVISPQELPPIKSNNFL